MAATIFAVATGAGRAAVAIVRLSGPDTAAALVALTGRLPPPRQASLRALCEPGTGTLIDRALVLWFPSPASFTGEDSAELHCHGGRAVVAALLRTLGTLPGCRLAGPGEFTRRALLNGRMSLPEVEGLADLIDAETEAQRRQAQRQLDGALGAWVAEQRERLLQAMAAAESAIDFSDEADVAGDFAAELRHQAALLRQAVAEQLASAQAAAHVRDGLVVALAGPPNAGKSTLLNALVRREVAIVSPHAGTTRDPVEAPLDLGGCLVQVVDTAGLRDSDDPVEREGVARALRRAAHADLVLWLSEAARPQAPAPALQGQQVWRVATKTDLGPAPVSDGATFAISVATGHGMAALLGALTAFAGRAMGDGQGVVTRERHRAALLGLQDNLDELLAGGPRVSLEVAAEQLRAMSRGLDSLMGRIETEEVLGAIFARFCVGK